MKTSELVRLALEEDIGIGDLTTDACVTMGAEGSAYILAKQDLVVCGQEAAAEVFKQCGGTYRPLVSDGTTVLGGTRIGEAHGPLRALLTAERVALNFLMRLSGIATHTRNVVAEASSLRVVDTRKTTPLHRALEKHAVRCGGAYNHRFGLFDGILIKDNHIVAAGGIAIAVARARSVAHHLLKVEIEVENLTELEEALNAGADVILLDNMDDVLLEQAVRITAGRAMLEASGNMNAVRLSQLAGRGIDVVSMGGLIHQARWVDLSMRVSRA